LDTCENSGGSHWKYDTEGASDDTNEFWWEFSGGGDGNDTTSIFIGVEENLNFALDERAMSVVVHSYVDATKLFCADIVQMPGFNYYTNTDGMGITAMSEEYAGYGYGGLYTSETATLGIFTMTMSVAVDDMFMGYIGDALCTADAINPWQYDMEMEVSEMNAFYFAFSDDGSQRTYSTSTLNENFAMMADDMTVASIVITVDGTQVICADLKSGMSEDSSSMMDSMSSSMMDSMSSSMMDSMSSSMMDSSMMDSSMMDSSMMDSSMMDSESMDSMDSESMDSMNGMEAGLAQVSASLIGALAFLIFQ